MIMNKGICTVSVAALRAEGSHRAEMISQVLYGETVEILDSAGQFARIKMHFDGYEGWIHAQQLSLISEEDFHKKKRELVTNSFDVYNTSQGKMLLSFGSEVRSEEQQISFLSGERIGDTARQFLNVPYLWSGRSFFGIDCSGFVQLVYKVHGKMLPRDSCQQAEVGEVLSFVEESRLGDLAFFEDEDGIISHVGMMLNQQEIIHSYGKVRVDYLDSTGIYNNDLKKHTHKLRFLRTIL